MAVGSSREALVEENAKLRFRVEELENKLAFLLTHQTLAHGLAGERLISRQIDGRLTVHTASFDVTTRGGEQIEVKSAKLTNAGARAGSPFARWMWQKVFGETNLKSYDFLVLIGEANSAHLSLYRDPKSPFVVFCIPYVSVTELTTAGTRGAFGIQLNSNPATARGRARLLYDTYQVTMAEFEERFGTQLF